MIGQPNLWLFNSSKDPKNPFILKKNPDNIRDLSILNSFLNMKGFNDPLENNMLLIKNYYGNHPE